MFFFSFSPDFFFFLFSAHTIGRQFVSSLVSEQDEDIARAMWHIGFTVTHCRFEATDPDSDEVVLSKILQVLLACVRGAAGRLITDDMVCEMVQTCYRMAFQGRLSELLRKTAEQTLLQVLLVVFARYGEYDAERASAERASAALAAAADAATASTATDASQTGAAAAAAAAADDAQFVNSRGVVFERDPSSGSGDEGSAGAAAAGGAIATPPASKLRPYGIACLERLFDWLCSLVRPGSANDGNPEVRALGLYLINSLLEHRGMSMQRFPSLLAQIQDAVSHCLLQTLLAEELGVLTLTLRIVFNLFSSMKQHLKPQLELLLRTMVALVARHQSAYEHQEVVLESFSELCRMPSFGVDLYVNYDCDMHCTNLFHDLCKFFYKNSFPASGALYTIHLLSLDCLLALLQSIEQRSGAAAVPGLPSLESLADMQRAKALLTAGAEELNKDLKSGVQYLLDRGLVEPDPAAPDQPLPASMAKFLRTAPQLSPGAIGDYIGRNKPLNIAVLDAYVETFVPVMAREGFMGGLRAFMESFRVPGEAHVISRVLETFAKHFFAHGLNARDFADVDSVYVLAYSTVMLNVDQHSDRVKKRMVEASFVQNNRKLNGGGNFPLELQQAIYNSIHAVELRVPEESSLELVLRARDPAAQAPADEAHAIFAAGTVPQRIWTDLIRRSARHQPFVDVRGAPTYDSELFAVLWRPLVAALSVIYDTASDGPILVKSAAGFELCARSGARFRLSDAVDAAVVALCKFSTLFAPPNGTVFDSAPPSAASGSAGSAALTSSAGALPAHHIAHRPRTLSTPTGHVASSASGAASALEYGASTTENPHVVHGAEHHSQSALQAAAVRFGRDAKARLAALHAMRTAAATARSLREAWRAVVLVVARLNSMELLPVDVLALPPLYGAGDVTPAKLYRKPVQKKPAASGSLLSYWFGSGSSAPPAATQPAPLSRQTIAALTEAKRAVDRLPLKRLLTSTVDLSDESLQYLLRTLVVLAVAPQPAQDDFPLQDETPAATTSVPTAAAAATVLAASDDGSAAAAAATTTTDDDAGKQRALEVERRVDVSALPGALCVDLLARLLLDNRARVARLGLWAVARERLVSSLAEARRASPLSLRTLESLFLLVAELAPSGDGGMAEELVTSLGALLKLDERVAQQFGEHVICGVRVVLERTSTVLRSAASWETLLSLIAGSADAARAAPIGFATLVRIVDSESLVTSDSFAFVERAAFAFARSGAVESAMSIKALECLYRLHCRVRHVLALRDRVANPASLALRNEAWRSYWLPLLRHLCAVCTDSRTDVRNAAMMILQRTLLGEDLLALGPEGWYACFAEVLFPLSDVLLQSSSPPPPAAKDADASAATAADGGQSSAPQLSTEKVASSSFLFSPVLAAVTGIQPGERPMQQWRASSTGSAGEGARGDPLEETRLRASALLCKIFLHYASTIRPSPEFNALWTSVLRYIERYMQADNSELLAEAVPESLKNILLVMSDSGVLRESSSATDDFGLWKLTWTTISRFCPRLTPSQLGIGSDAVVAPIVAVAVSGAAIANDALTKPNLPQQPVDQQQQQPHTEQTPVQQEQQQEQQQQQQPAVAAAAAVAVPVQLAAPLVQVQTSLVQQAGAARPGAPAHFASRVVTQLNTSV
jgi:brefeldin A-resistance guanine nucleotide exchange factor 1